MAPPRPPERVRVWDPLQRVLHWTLAACVALAWWAGEERLSLHLVFGYIALACAGVRAVWGFAGSRHARFAGFVHRPAQVWRYARAVATGTEHRFIGHNPLGGWMVLALLVCVAVVCTSGILYTTDRFWGLAWVEQLHRVSAWTLVGLVALHLAGVAFTSWRHRENLVAAMIGGRKRADDPSPD
jgi:cytochrome b